MKQSDEALMAAHLNGDSTAFEELVRRHSGSLLGYLTHMSGNRDRAEDFFQDTFKRVHLKCHTFRTDGRFKPWLFAIATNVAISGLRKTSRRPKVVSLNVNSQCNGNGCTETQTIPITDMSNEPSQEVIKSEQKELVAKAVENLPARQKAALIMSYYKGLTYKEVANALGCSVGTIKTQIFRALQKLSVELETIRGGVK